mmetsp:Transcript_21304/g.27514  ORF Transcript_21304/g.27514 Transcript_21304/m.27514 type:complete len:317 (+) Transcript_21304:273-1223(+)|eukprot:CAMPEP_0198151400 /NCGR_PEP_ID=MMETSP1443-20131203/55526_1 /TAXON_ID=186043 /ORGANISM="Entomoneis sp., Strain CCMP2396" /LENGTH=316 /DNA_ID=CAMNT_0043817047 /DNA_START=254 /DNA_END=1204 /DNA_ORIENTATION=-
MTNSTSEKKVITSAPPHWHSVIVILLFGVFFLWLLPTKERLDEAATMDTFTQVLFPQYMDLYTIAYSRAFIAVCIWAVTLNMVTSKGWEQNTSYLAGSKLKIVPNHLVGIKTCFPFTSLCWNLLGISFTLSAYIAMQGARGEAVSPLILRTALVAWEIAAPCTLLVASVIRYAIWPGVLAKGMPTKNLKTVRNIFMHNINVFFAVSESALLGGLPVRWTEISLAPLFAIAYVVFTWNMTTSWNKREHGVQFIYFFFDTTLPGYTCTIALVALMGALLIFFVIFCSCEKLLAWLDSGIWASLGYVFLICSGVMRFRD